MLLKNILLQTIVMLLIPSVLSFEPTTCILGIGAVASLIYSINHVKCYFHECCNDRWIVNNMTALKLQLNQRVYGQHLVRRAVMSHIHGHLQNHNPERPLVLSFHGPTGSGKNHVSRIIAEALYKNGMTSEYVHLISVTKDYHHEHKIPAYKAKLSNLIEKEVKKCPQSMFIFDEIDKLPAGLVDTIKPYIDYHQITHGVDFRSAVFIFLSNAGAESITQHVLQRWRDGAKREDIALFEVENIIAKASVNNPTKGGLWHSEIVSKHLITAYIPFLPLEREHVRQCIRDSMVMKKHYKSHRKVPNSKVQGVLAEMTFYPEKEQLFSVSGCKRVAEKVDYVLF
ncbi:hypothetical protein ACOMHN_011302 [Nucella lapillus]